MQHRQRSRIGTTASQLGLSSLRHVLPSTSGLTPAHMGYVTVADVNSSVYSQLHSELIVRKVGKGVNLFLVMLQRRVMAFRSIATSIIGLGAGGDKWLTSRIGRFTPGKERRYPWNARLDGSKSWYGRDGEQENLLSFPGFEPRTLQLVA